MRIVDVRPIVLRSRLKTPIRFSLGTIEHRVFALVRIDTDEAVYGIGETSVNFPHWSVYERVATVEYGIKPLLLGEDPLEIERLWVKMESHLIRQGLQWGAKGVVYQAISAADLALWDIAGKVAGLPVWRLLGGSGGLGIPLYATGLDPADVEGASERCVAAGFRAVKLRVGFGQERDVDLVRRVRRVVGPDVDVMVDANMAWSRDEAVRIGGALEDMGVFWMEEPVRCDDLDGMRWVAERVRIPLAAGENSFGLAEARLLVDSGAVWYIMPDVTRSGGLTECRRICAYAVSRGIPYSPHNYGSDVAFAASLQLMACTPGGGMLLRDVSECEVREAILEEPLQVSNGRAWVPSGPGLGVRLDERAIERFRWSL